MSRPLTIDLPDDVVADAEAVAGAAGESLESFVLRAVASEIERERTDRFFAERRARGDVVAALEVLNRAGGEPPAPGDELP
jgi:hypothetical protein